MSSRIFDTACTIAVEQSEAHFHAHVELDDNIAIFPGDRVLVHGAPIQVSFGERVVFNRTATVTRAGPLARAWTRIAAYFDFAELVEVSFNPGRIK